MGFRVKGLGDEPPTPPVVDAPVKKYAALSQQLPVEEVGVRLGHRRRRGGRGGGAG